MSTILFNKDFSALVFYLDVAEDYIKPLLNRVLLRKFFRSAVDFLFFFF